MTKLPQLQVTLKTGEEPFRCDGQTLPLKLLDFWRWSASDLTNNRTRGILAEFIVASALGCAQNARIEWDAHDLLTFSGLKIEVKSAAYLQSWEQKALSKIRFGIRPTQNLNEGAASLTKRQSQVYVFCLLHHQDKSTVDPLNLAQWTFYVLPTKILDREKTESKSVTLSDLRSLGALTARYQELAACIETLSV